jgi:hypothetical protein
MKMNLKKFPRQSNVVECWGTAVACDTKADARYFSGWQKYLQELFFAYRESLFRKLQYRHSL